MPKQIMDEKDFVDTKLKSALKGKPWGSMIAQSDYDSLVLSAKEEYSKYCQAVMKGDPSLFKKVILFQEETPK